MIPRFEFDTDEWALANIPYFRGLGFFADLAERTDGDVLMKIKERYVELFGLPYTKKGKSPPPWEIELAPPLADLCMLRYDYSRVWWDDTECVYPPDQLAYEDAISKWAAISRGAFAPTEIQETWSGTDDAPESPTVRIKLANGTLTLTPYANGDWFDLSTLAAINRHLSDPDIRFELYEQYDQTAFVVTLKPSEKKELSKTRGWLFHEFDDHLTETSEELGNEKPWWKFW